MAEEYVNLSGTYLPEYQEKYLKDLMANVYQTDEDGNVSGIASSSPLYGTPVTDAEGNPVYELDEQGNPRLDQYGEQIQQVEGGVPRPDVMRMTQAQQDAIALQKSGIGLYEDAMDLGAKTLDTGLGAYQQGVGTLEGTTERYDPTSYKEFYDPFVGEVIDQTYSDLDEAQAMEQGRLGADTVAAGAFGGSRQGIQQALLAKDTMGQKAKFGSQLRSQAYQQAQQGAQSAFENQQNRGQQAAQIFGQLGQGIAGLGVKQAALGEAAQGAAQRDVNALFNVGSIEQQQQQTEYDVQRNAAIEEAYEPFQRFSYMSDIFRGVPSTQQTMTTSSMPRPNPMNMVYNTLGGQSAATAGLGGLRNVSGS